jgi:enamine deaminase RidA (YjgF/YER057c/UK114 family)
MSQVVRLRTNKRRGRAVIHDGIVYIGGQTADDRSVGIREQTKAIIDRIEQILLDAGSNKSNLLNVQIWLRDIERDFGPMNEVWDAWIPDDAGPARATVQAILAAPDVLIEIVMTAVVPSISR